MSGDPDKLDLMQWADRRREVDLQAKVILQKFAAFADAEGRTWRKVADLAEDANCSIRTVHSRLRWLEENRYIRPTGEMHRLKDSTRSVPVYVLRPTFEVEDVANSMCANSAYMRGACVQTGAGMCATGCTCIDTQEPLEEQKGAGARADERVGVSVGEAYARIEAAYPPEALGFTDPDAARAVLADLIGQGVEVGDLVAAAADFAVSPMLSRRTYGPVALQRWLSEGRYRGFGPFLERAKAARAGSVAGAAGVGAGSVAGAWTGPEALRADLLGLLGDGFAATLARCAWAVEGRRVRACTGWAFEKLRAAAGIFEQHGCELVAPNGGDA